GGGGAAGRASGRRRWREGHLRRRRRAGAGVGPGGARERAGRGRPRRARTGRGPGAVELVGDAVGVRAVAVLPDGRLVAGVGGRVLVWDPAEPGTGPVELGNHELEVTAVAVLPDGGVVTRGSG